MAAPVDHRRKDTKHRHRIFVMEYLIDGDAPRAAIEAGYSKSNVSVTAATCLKNYFVKKAIEEGMREKEKRCSIDADGLLERLCEEVDADLADIYYKDKDEKSGLKPVHEWPLIWRQGLVDSIDVSRDGEVLRVHLSDRLKRLRMIGQHINVKAFTEKDENQKALSLAAILAEANKMRALSSGEEKGDIIDAEICGGDDEQVAPGSGVVCQDGV